MRVGIFVVSAILAGAGVAFAQSDWVVDPWSPPSVAPSSARSARAAAAPASRRHARVEWVDERNFELTDPWLSSTPAPRGVSSPTPNTGVQAPPAPPRRPRESGDWAKPLQLLVDPWAPEPPKARVPAPDLIVDPWANDVYRP
ncbi:MAG TPA: hypothetical protein VI197_24010 [Polyangiaceae bacterium]